MKNTQLHKRAFLIWLAIYPLITLLFNLFGNYLALLPLALCTLLLTIIAVPLVVYYILPFYQKLFSKWLES
jgi:antibiotic biosynthesis monooxygenase (ABM) superfamily enzyme